MRSISSHGRDRARPFAVEIGQRRFALALFLRAGSIATHGAAMPTFTTAPSWRRSFGERSNTMETSIDKKRVLALAIIACGVLAGPALAQGASDAQIFINTKDIKWTDAPPSMPRGAKIAVLQGDPGKAGPFVMRLKTPAGYKVAPHWHSQEENLTVISGTLYLGMGDKLDTKSEHALSAGGFHFLPGKVHHYAFAKVPTVVQGSSNGPLDIIYVNPEDDPQKAKK